MSLIDWTFKQQGEESTAFEMMHTQVYEVSKLQKFYLENTHRQSIKTFKKGKYNSQTIVGTSNTRLLLLLNVPVPDCEARQQPVLKQLYKNRCIMQQR